MSRYTHIEVMRDIGVIRSKAKDCVEEIDHVVGYIQRLESDVLDWKASYMVMQAQRDRLREEGNAHG